MAVSTVKMRQAQQRQMKTLLFALEYFENQPCSVRAALERTVLDDMLQMTQFTTVPRQGSGLDVIELVVGRAAYSYMQEERSVQPLLSTVPGLFIRCGASLLYKGICVTTDAMLRPNTWMLHPNAVLALCSRQVGNNVLYRPFGLYCNIPEEVIFKLEGPPDPR